MDKVNPMIVKGAESKTIDGRTNSPKYITITSSGIKAEGLEYQGFFTNKDAALTALQFYIDRYLDGKNFVSWRTYPKVTCDENTYYKDTSFYYQQKGIHLEPVKAFHASCRVYAE